VVFALPVLGLGPRRVRRNGRRLDGGWGLRGGPLVDALPVVLADDQEGRGVLRGQGLGGLAVEVQEQRPLIRALDKREVWIAPDHLVVAEADFVDVAGVAVHGPNLVPSPLEPPENRGSHDHRHDGRYVLRDMLRPRFRLRTHLSLRSTLPGQAHSRPTR